ncbi:porin [Vibrio vulnificus]|uniref:porin n=1 Tax=Vibrio vulnificus TaxID=672 RepID=UPI000B9FE1C9|nr:porin [Vibrio vulnificus]EGR8989629.1 porin [Vibrio vulnificus]OZS53185.1 porin [Vibrio vulnificus]OZS59103.1 porin [Vibrio vulnificus]OZS62602.1 porin [Vibrio vulnificus]PAO27229.1 porin [Vibrio vulnificus]
MRINKPLLTTLPILCFTSFAHAQTVYDDQTNKLDIYGRVEGQIINNSDDTLGKLGGRLGFDMSRELDVIENSRVIGKFEWQVRTETNDTRLNAGEDLEARYNYIGLENDNWGMVIFGRTKNPLYQVMKMTDKYKNYTPGIYNFGISSIDTSYKYNRQDATLQYNGEFGIHEIQAAYVFGNGENERLDHGVMTSYRMNYKGDGFKISPAIALSQYQRDNKNTSTKRKQHDQILAGIEASFNQFTFSLTGNKTNIELDNGGDEKYFGLDSLIAYKWDQFQLLAGYSFLDEKNEDIYEKEDWRVEGQWTLARRTFLSLTFDRELAAKNTSSEDKSITLGLRYDF